MLHTFLLYEYLNLSLSILESFQSQVLYLFFNSHLVFITLGLREKDERLKFSVQDMALTNLMHKTAKAVNITVKLKILNARSCVQNDKTR